MERMRPGGWRGGGGRSRGRSKEASRARSAILATKFDTHNDRAMNRKHSCSKFHRTKSDYSYNWIIDCHLMRIIQFKGVRPGDRQGGGERSRCRSKAPFRASCLLFMVYGLWFTVQGSSFRVEGLGLMVYGL